MTFTVTIDGTPVSVQSGSLSIAKAIASRETLRAVVRSMDGSYRPSIGDEIVVTQDASVVFGGVIESVRETAANEQASAVAIDSEIGAIDYRGLPDQRVVIANRPSETLLARLTWLTSTIGLGLTLHGSQATGPTLETASYDGVTASAVLNELALLTGYQWVISPSKVLRMQLPSANMAPFDLDSSDPIWLGDIEVSPTRQSYANSVIVRAGDAKVVEKTGLFTGNGSASSWTLAYPAVGDRGYVTANGVFQTLGIGAQWTRSGSTLTRNGGALPNGHVVTIVYDAQFPIYVTVEDAGEISANGRVDLLISKAGTYDIAEATAFGSAELAMRLAWLTDVVGSTYRPGLLPGQQITANVAERNVLSQVGVIKEVTITNDAGNGRLRHAVSLTVGSVLQTWRDTFSGWSGGGSTGVSGGTLVVQQAGQMPTGNVVAQEGSIYVTEVGLLSPHAAIGSHAGLRIGPHTATLTEQGWFVLNRPGPDSGRTELVFYDNRDGAGSSPLSLRYNSSLSCYVLGPPAASIFGTLDIGHDSTGRRIANVNAVNVRASTAYYERGRSVPVGEWQSYTPTWGVASGTAPSVGDGSLSGSYCIIGKTVHWRLRLAAGSSTTFGSGGAWTFTLPVASVTYDAQTPMAVVSAFDAAPAFADGQAMYSTSTVVLPRTGAALAVITNAAPWTWANGDALVLMGTYEAA